MVVNTAEVLPGDFTRNAEFSLPIERLKRAIVTAAGSDHTHFIDAARLATGAARPVDRRQHVHARLRLSDRRAAAVGARRSSARSNLNGEAVAMNIAAFRWGRRAAVDPAAVEAAVAPPADAVDPARKLSQSFDEVVARRVAYLTAYQDAAYAARYKALVDTATAAEAAKAPGKCGLADAVARYLFKLMAYKDEYEVARLYSDGAFQKQVANELGGERLRFNVHLAPPLLARRDKRTGVPRKMTFGPWIFSVFGVLAKLKFLRGTAFDPFGYTDERQTERQLVRDYEAMLTEIVCRR